MLADPHSERFISQFTEQWLDLRALERVAVNPEFYPEFNSRVMADMRRETEAFFEEILRNDVSALNFLDSDFTMLNERLAKHYGIEGVVGTEMSRAPLPENSAPGRFDHSSEHAGRQFHRRGFPSHRSSGLDSGANPRRPSVTPSCERARARS